MKAIIPESKFTKVLYTYLNMSFKGFDDCTYDWANFNCGMGVCCDPYAIGFVVAEIEYDDYLFKLTDSEHYDDDGDYGEELKGELPEPCHNPPDISNPAFDTIVIDEEIYERLNDLFNNINVWREPLLSIINKVFHTNANNLIYRYDY
jgi:hypothetical protein